MFRINRFLSAIILLTCTGCAAQTATESTSQPALPAFVTATLPPTLAPLPTDPPIAPTAAPTLPPVNGTTNSQINVRAETHTASANYGVLPPFTSIQIIGQDATGTWYQILYPNSPTGAGWIRSEYVQVEPTAEIEVRDVAAGFGFGVSGLVISGINVRSGPGTEYETLGVLIPKDVVLVISRNESGAWVQFQFTDSPDGTGWAAAEFLQIENVAALPVSGEVVPPQVELQGENTPASTAPLIALPDGDSLEAPLVRAALSAVDSRTVLIQGSLSAPEGDPEDWIAVSTSIAEVIFHVSCEEGSLQLELWQGNSVKEAHLIQCGDKRTLKLEVDEIYYFRLSEPSTDEDLFTEYRLKIEVHP